MRISGRTAASIAWGVALLALAGSLTSWWRALPATEPYRPEPPHAPAPPLAADTADLRASAEAAGSRNPFRLDRKPAQVRFDPWKPPPTPPTRTKPQRTTPTLSLVGIAGGPPWAVLVRGVPGHDRSTVLWIGEETGGIRLDAVRGDTALLSGFDTTWTLAPRRY